MLPILDHYHFPSTDGVSTLGSGVTAMNSDRQLLLFTTRLSYTSSEPPFKPTRGALLRRMHPLQTFNKPPPSVTVPQCHTNTTSLRLRTVSLETALLDLQ